MVSFGNQKTRGGGVRYQVKRVMGAPLPFIRNGFIPPLVYNPFQPPLGGLKGGIARVGGKIGSNPIG